MQHIHWKTTTTKQQSSRNCFKHWSVFFVCLFIWSLFLTQLLIVTANCCDLWQHCGSPNQGRQPQTQRSADYWTLRATLWAHAQHLSLDHQMFPYIPVKHIPVPLQCRHRQLDSGHAWGCSFIFKNADFWQMASARPGLNAGDQE